MVAARFAPSVMRAVGAASALRPAVGMGMMRSAARPAAIPARNAVPSLSRSYHDKVIDHVRYSPSLCVRFLVSTVRQADPASSFVQYENPRNVGSFSKKDTDVGIGLVGAPACGDVMKLSIRVNENGIISDVRFKTFGCGSAIASSSYMTERVKGMTLEEAGGIKNTEIAKELCLPPVKLHCSMLAEDAIKSAIRNYKAKRDATGNMAAGHIDVEQSAATGETTTSVHVGSSAQQPRPQA